MACYADRYWQHPENAAFSARMHQVIAEVVAGATPEVLAQHGITVKPFQSNPNDPEVQRLKRYMEEMKQRHSQIPRSISCSCVGVGV